MLHTIAFIWSVVCSIDSLCKGTLEHCVTDPYCRSLWRQLFTGWPVVCCGGWEGVGGGVVGQAVP